MLAGLALDCSSCRPRPQLEPVVFSEGEERQIRKHSPLPALPLSPTNLVADDPAAAHFGQQLFFDARLSSNSAVSCATCHDPAKQFSDGLALSEGLGQTDRHSQSLWNVAYQRWMFWDGRADSLWSQSIQPMLDPREMGATPEHLRGVIAGDPELRSGYQGLFGEAENHSPDRFLANLGKSIEAYERKIISSDSPFDRFVAALPDGGGYLDEAARRGLRLFVGRGQCSLCHSGPNFSDGEFHNIGLSRDPDLPRDSGRFEGGRKVVLDRFNG
ncbi:MAG: cytochrome-c peroxidase, partial [Verrucomicrobiales bacterium]